MSTKISVAQQILYKIYGRDSKSSDPIQLPDVVLAVGQQANYLLKGNWFDGTKMGERIPENLMLAEYPKQPLVSYGGKKSRCKLPVMPISLPKNMGTWQVSKDEFFSCIGIPIQSGQADLLRVQDMISDLMGQWAYEVNGVYIDTTTDLTIGGTDGLYFRLVVVDVASLGDYDLLPITADMEAQLIQQVYQSFVPAPQADRKVDAYSSTTQPAQQ